MLKDREFQSLLPVKRNIIEKHFLTLGIKHAKPELVIGWFSCNVNIVLRHSGAYPCTMLIM